MYLLGGSWLRRLRCRLSHPTVCVLQWPPRTASCSSGMVKLAMHKPEKTQMNNFFLRQPMVLMMWLTLIYLGKVLTVCLFVCFAKIFFLNRKFFFLFIFFLYFQFWLVIKYISSFLLFKSHLFSSLHLFLNTERSLFREFSIHQLQCCFLPPQYHRSEVGALHHSGCSGMYIVIPVPEALLFKATCSKQV